MLLNIFFPFFKFYSFLCATILQIVSLDAKSYDWVWFRTTSADIFATTDKRHCSEIITGTENKTEYRLERDDVGHYIGVLFAPLGRLGRAVEEEGGQSLVLNTVGPVLPGPPRCLDFHISGSMVVGQYARADYRYIGGSEGRSEVWWMRISPDGKRTQVSDPQKIPESGSSRGKKEKDDARYYLITAEDVGCTLKAKCRPTRTDNAQGEIFTSKGSEVIAKT